jgi:hypothetical protein
LNGRPVICNKKFIKNKNKYDYNSTTQLNRDDEFNALKVPSFMCSFANKTTEAPDHSSSMNAGIKNIVSNFDNKKNSKAKAKYTSYMVQGQFNSNNKNKTPNPNRLEFRRLEKNSSVSKSVALVKAMTPRDTVKPLSKTASNEYGLNNLKTYRINPKHFNDPISVISSIANEKPSLKNNEIDRYMHMLSNYIKNKQDSKTITTLKILLTHFTRKSNDKGSSKRSNKSRVANSYSMIDSARIIQAYDQMNNKEEHKSSLKTEAYSLRQKFTNKNRKSAGINSKKFLVDSSSSVAKTARKHIPKEIELYLNESQSKARKVENVEFKLGKSGFEKVINSDKKSSLYAKKPLNIDVGFMTSPPNVSTPNGKAPEHNEYIRKRSNALKLVSTHTPTQCNIPNVEISPKVNERNTEIKPKPKGTLMNRRRSRKIRKTLEVLHFVLLVSITKLQLHNILIIA